MNFFDMPAELKVTEMAWPTKIVLGPGALGRVPAQIERLKMKRPLVVTDAGVVKVGLADKLFSTLRDAQIGFETFDKVEPNPTEKDAFDGVAFFNAKKCDGVIGIGGEVTPVPCPVAACTVAVSERFPAASKASTEY